MNKPTQLRVTAKQLPKQSKRTHLKKQIHGSVEWGAGITLNTLNYADYLQGQT